MAIQRKHERAQKRHGLGRQALTKLIAELKSRIEKLEFELKVTVSPKSEDAATEPAPAPKARRAPKKA